MGGLKLAKVSSSLNRSLPEYYNDAEVGYSGKQKTEVLLSSEAVSTAPNTPAPRGWNFEILPSCRDFAQEDLQSSSRLKKYHKTARTSWQFTFTGAYHGLGWSDDENAGTRLGWKSPRCNEGQKKNPSCSGVINNTSTKWCSFYSLKTRALISVQVALHHMISSWASFDWHVNRMFACGLEGGWGEGGGREVGVLYSTGSMTHTGSSASRALSGLKYLQTNNLHWSQHTQRPCSCSQVRSYYLPPKHEINLCIHTYAYSLILN